MTFTARGSMRRCGRRWLTEEEALRSKRGLTGLYGAVPCHCQGWHLERLEKPAVPRLETRDTGPDRKTRLAVYDRDGHACVCCGISVIGKPHSIGHRKRRSQGGSNGMSNLLTFLGWGNGLTGKDDHHYRIDSRKDPEDRHRGYSVNRDEDPALIPVQYFEQSGSGFTAWLADSGELIFEQPARSA